MKRKKIIPKVYNWYMDREDNQSFMVIYIDEDEGLVEVQYLNGDLAEFDLEEWGEMYIKKIAQPEDWGGGMDGMEEEYLDFG